MIHQNSPLIEQQDSPPLVSVIMNCYNGEKFVKQAIDSVLAQTYQNYEIIFWDNASTDNSAKIAKSYDSRLRYFQSKQNVSLGLARNWAIEETKGEYVAFLDCDDIWSPEKLEKQIPLFKKSPQIALVYSDAIFFQDENPRKRFLAYGKQKPPEGKIFARLLEKSNFLCLGSVVLKKEVLKNIGGGFDSRFNLGEEMDVFLRIAYRWEGAYVDEPLLMYRIHAQSLSALIGHEAPREIEWIIEKLIHIYPEIPLQFERELKILQAHVQYCYALEDFRQGNRNRVRQRLRPQLMIKKKLWIPYLFSFFPFRFYKFLLDITGQYHQL